MSLVPPYRAIREGAALVDRSGRGLLRLTGRDAASYLQGLLTNDIKSLAPGEACYAAYLTPQGRMIADMRVLRTGDALLLVVSGAVRPALRDRLEQLIFSEDVQVIDLTETWTGFGLYGPRAADVLTAYVGPNAPAYVGPNFSSAEPPNAPVYVGPNFSSAEPPVVCAPTDALGVPGYDVLVERGRAEEVRAALLGAGAIAADPEAATLVRVERGVPEFGADMDEETIPLEAGIEDRAISFTKGCYVGQEVIIRVRDRGHGRVARRLVGLLVEGSQIPRAADRIVANGRDAGRVTSAVASPALGRPIALGYVHRDFVEPGTRVSIAHGERRLDATVAALPFV